MTVNVNLQNVKRVRVAHLRGFSTVDFCTAGDSEVSLFLNGENRREAAEAIGRIVAMCERVPLNGNIPPPAPDRSEPMVALEVVGPDGEPIEGE